MLPACEIFQYIKSNAKHENFIVQREDSEEPESRVSVAHSRSQPPVHSKDPDTKSVHLKLELREKIKQTLYAFETQVTGSSGCLTCQQSHCNHKWAIRKSNRF